MLTSILLLPVNDPSSNFVPVTLHEICDILDSQEYLDAAQEKIDEVKGAYDQSETYSKRDYLYREQISLLMELINEKYSWNYRMGFYHNPDPTNWNLANIEIEGMRGPVVFVCHRPAGRHVSFTKFYTSVLGN